MKEGTEGVSGREEGGEEAKSDRKSQVAPDVFERVRYFLFPLLLYLILLLLLVEEEECNRE